MSEHSGAQQKSGFQSSKTAADKMQTSKQLLIARVVISGIVAAVLSAFLVTLNIPKETLTPEEVNREIVAKQELRANFSFQTEDIKSTQEAKNQARAKIPPHYRVDQEKVQRQIQILRNRLSKFQEIRTKILNNYIQETKDKGLSDSAQVLSYVQREFNKSYSSIQWNEKVDAAKLVLWVLADVNLPNQNVINPLQYEANPVPTNEGILSPLMNTTSSFYQEMEKVTEESLSYVLNEGILSNKEQEPSGVKIVVIKGTSGSDQKTTQELNLSEVPDVKKAIEEKLKPRIQEESKKIAKQYDTSFDWIKIYDAIFEITSDLVIDTLHYDPVTTEIVRERAAELVNPVMKEITAGEIIQERGKRWTLESRSDAKTYLQLLEQSQGKINRWIFSFVAHLIIALLAFAGLYRAIYIWEHKGEPSIETIWYLALLLILGILLLGRGMQYFDSTGFSVPIAIVGILFAILVQMKLAAFLSCITCILLSILFHYDWRLLVFDIAMTMGAVFTIYRVRKRRDITSASFSGIVIGFLVLLALTLTMDTFVGETVVRRIFLLAVNGSLCILVVPGILPFLERLFGIVTDFQLLEYSDLNNEILRKLAVNAPATYSHSLILGQLAESAADAIEANGLLARVCAYYHDIGKINHSEYFYENQNGNNIHDNLSPRNSVRIILSHVLEGIKLAQEYKLPKPVIDAIAQHHGTFRVGYFYQLALAQQKFGDVDEQDYRYPGPKPRKPEYAVLMICDASESAVRSIKNSNPERIRQMVDRIVTERANDGQFDECDLTFKQLNIIIEDVSRTLTSLLHLRPSYPNTADIEEEHNSNSFSKNSNGQTEILTQSQELSGK
ncbi:MAG TPA: HDIG domain-containing protein [Candidatus Hydrogenedens sp.]|nr:HDIG domain-containing protein [Candidatus Hydrogenedens sp.]